jgi:hypothetical protein
MESFGASIAVTGAGLLSVSPANMDDLAATSILSQKTGEKL